MHLTKYLVLVLSLTFAITLQELDARTILGTGNGFFPQEEAQSQAQVSNQYFNDQDPEQEQQFRFPKSGESKSENALRSVDESAIAVEDTEADVEGDEDPEIDAKFLSNINVNNLTPEQRAVYDELIELAKEEEETSQSQVQGRTFGLFKLKFHHLWKKFKSLFSGPKFLEFYSEPEVVPVVQPQQYPYGQPYSFYGDDDFKKRNELPSETPAVQYRVENPLLSIPIVGDLTKFITRTIPKFYYELFQQPTQQAISNSRQFYSPYGSLDQFQY